VGYFPNGTAGELYAEQYCDRCLHSKDGCAVWLAHFIHNYEECNNDKSILHELIPRDGITNKKCLMFIEDKPPEERVQLVDLIKPCDRR
jgi:hypothetical protein